MLDFLMFENEHGYTTLDMIVFFIIISIAINIILLPKKIKIKQRNKIASLVVSSNLHSIPDIAHHAKISEDKVVKILRILTSDSSDIVLANDARYLKGAKLNLQTMEITLSDKYIKKEPWICVYCRTVNKLDELVCQSCHASKKKL